MDGVCDVCGNQYDKIMVIQANGAQGRYDCFECAIQAMAPQCLRCGVRILGHGLQEEDQIFCCASCARMAGQAHFVDRVTDIPV